jgi:hypothetical protein
VTKLRRQGVSEKSPKNGVWRTDISARNEPHRTNPDPIDLAETPAKRTKSVLRKPEKRMWWRKSPTYNVGGETSKTHCRAMG